MSKNIDRSAEDPRITLLIGTLDRSFRGPAWHGPTLLGSIRGVDLDQASWRPGRHRHNVWELVVHCAYWKYRACAKLTDLARGSFGMKGSNFFERPAPDSVWEVDLQLLRDWHERLQAAVVTFDAGRLEEHVGRDRYTFEMLIDGIASHDVYHAGQIQLLKKLKSRNA